MAKKPNVNNFLVECIETCWRGQKAMLDDQCDEYKALTARVEAFQEVYAHLNDGDEYDGSSDSDVLDDDRPVLDEEEPKAPVEEDEEDGEESETEDE